MTGIPRRIFGGRRTVQVTCIHEREQSYLLNTVLKAHVHNGRLVLDEPTDLPEGEVIYLQPVSEDDFDDEERAALHRELEASIAESGDLSDANDVLAELRAMK